MKHFFNPEHFLWRGIGRAADLFGLSICWMLLCLPVLTVVPACVSLYDAIAHTLTIGDDPHCYRRFFRTLRNELKRGVLLSVLWLGLAAVLAFGYQFVGQLVSPQLRPVVSVMFLALTTIPVCVLTWLIPIQSRFVYDFRSLHRTAAAFVLTQLPTTAALLAIFMTGLLAHFYLPFLVMFLPAVIVWGQSRFIERVFSQSIVLSPAP